MLSPSIERRIRCSEIPFRFLVRIICQETGFGSRLFGILRPSAWRWRILICIPDYRVNGNYPGSSWALGFLPCIRAARKAFDRNRGFCRSSRTHVIHHHRIHIRLDLDRDGSLRFPVRLSRRSSPAALHDVNRNQWPILDIEFAGKRVARDKDQRAPLDCWGKG